MKFSKQHVEQHVAKISDAARLDMVAGQWDEVMTDALYAACGAKTPEEMAEARKIAQMVATRDGCRTAADVAEYVQQESKV